MFFANAHVARYGVASRTERCHLFVEEGLRGVFGFTKVKGYHHGCSPRPTNWDIYVHAGMIEIRN